MTGREVDAVFTALADPTRRAVVTHLAAGAATTASQLAAILPVSRQAVAKHLHTLDRAGLVERRREGRESRYELNAAPMHQAIAWLATVGAQWDERLAALRAMVEQD